DRPPGSSARPRAAAAAWWPARPVIRPSVRDSSARRSRPCGRARAAARPCSRPSGRGRPFRGSLDVLQSYARNRTAALLQRRVVSLSLRLDQPAEAELLIRDRQLRARVVDDLEEAADRRAPLVQLPGRGGVAGAGTRGGDANGRRARLLGQGLEALLLGGVDERLDRDVVAGARLREELLRRPFRPRLRDSPLATAGKDLARSVLRLLDVGLVERVDLEDRTGDGGCELPPEEL